MKRQQPFENCRVIWTDLPNIVCCRTRCATLECLGSFWKQSLVDRSEACFPKIPGQVQHAYEVAQQVPVSIACSQCRERQVIA